METRKEFIIDVGIEKITILEELHETIILNDINFQIAAGEIYTIIGANGSGKTTLLKSLTRLLPSEKFLIEGKIIFKDKNLLQIDAVELNEIRKKNIKYVFQDAKTSFDPLKKLEYYFRFAGEDKEPIKKLLDYFELPSIGEFSKMHGYELSGGMAQRFVIVLALSANPDLLILDEPTSAIDVGSANLLKIKLRDFIKDNHNSVLIVTQNLEFAKKSSDKIARISENSISEISHFDSASNLGNSEL